MPKNNFELLADEKKEALLTAAIELFSDKRYDDVGLEDITAGLNLSSASFYRYFKDKEDLLLTALNFQNSYDELSEDFIRNPRDIESERPLREQKLVYHLRNLPEETLRRLYFGRYKDMTKSVFHKELLKLKYEGALREDIDPDLIAYMYATTMYNLQLYFREMGLNGLEDVELCSKMIKTFYHSFFRHGLIKTEEKKERTAEAGEKQGGLKT